MKQSTEKNVQKNIVFIIVLILLAGVCFIAQSFRPMQTATDTTEDSLYYAELHLATKGENEVLTYSLEEDARYDVETDSGYTIHLEVRDSAIRFVDSPCPDHICEQYGWIRTENQFATCAPAGATVIITPKQ